MMELHDTVQSSPAKDIKTVAYVVDHAGADFTLKDIVLDGPKGNEYLIEMKYSGICHTVSLADAHAAKLNRLKLAGPDMPTR